MIEELRSLWMLWRYGWCTKHRVRTDYFEGGECLHCRREEEWRAGLEREKRIAAASK